MKVSVINLEKTFPRLMKCMKCTKSPNSGRISMITRQENKYYETVLMDPNPFSIGYLQEANLSDWGDFTGEIVLSN